MKKVDERIVHLIGKGRVVFAKDWEDEHPVCLGFTPLTTHGMRRYDVYYVAENINKDLEYIYDLEEITKDLDARYVIFDSHGVAVVLFGSDIDLSLVDLSDTRIFKINPGEEN